MRTGTKHTNGMTRVSEVPFVEFSREETGLSVHPKDNHQTTLINIAHRLIHGL